MSRKTVLFVAENVTLAQVVRLAVLARSLDPERYRVVFACSEFPSLIFEGTSFEQRPIFTIPKDRVLRASAQGRRLYGHRVLRRYVRDELALIDAVRPDLVIGDLRWSLAVSAPVAGVPYASLINAYWSPYVIRDGFPMPDHPIVQWLGVELASRYFPKALPWVFASFARPMNDLRREHGLTELGTLLDVLCAGDFVLYSDVPAIVPTRSLPAHHLYLGAIQWAPPMPLPKWWEKLDPALPAVYATLGSSGAIDALPRVLDALGALPVVGLVATAGRATPSRVPRNVRCAPFLPGDLAARRANLVVSNGGSTTGYQALAEAVPVVGLASNFDQYLAMTAIEAAGGGKLLRAGTAKTTEIRDAIALVLESAPHHSRALVLSVELDRYDAKARFRRFVAAAIG